MLTSLDDAAHLCIRSVLAQVGPVRIQIHVPPPVLAVEQLARLEWHADRVGVLCHALTAPEAYVRTVAACALAQFGDGAEGALYPLLHALDDRNTMVRMAAVCALGSLGHRAAPAIPALIDLLQDEELRGTAAIALGRMGTSALDAREALEDLARDPSDYLRWIADQALCAICEPLAVAV